MSRPAHTAFTLIELMISVAVLAVLAGLLIPAATTVHGLALQMKCSSNLRQVGMAVLAYAGDHDDVLPAAQNFGDDNPATSPAWFFRLPPYTGQRDVKRASSVFQCAAFRWSGPQRFTNATPKSFKMNARLNADGRSRHYRLGTFTAEHEYVLFIDGVAKETGAGQWGHCTPSPNVVDATRHRGAVNILALDGHTLSDRRRPADGDWAKALRWEPDSD